MYRPCYFEISTTLNIYTKVGLLMGLVSKHAILIVEFANELQQEGKSKREAVERQPESGCGRS